MRSTKLSRLVGLLTALTLTGACSKLGDPFAGITPDQLFTFTIAPGAGTPPDVLPADGQSIRKALVEVKDAKGLYSQLNLVAASDEFNLSLSGTRTGATHTLNVPLAGPQGVFYVVAPRDYQPRAVVTISIGAVRQLQEVAMRPSAPNRLEVPTATVQATAGTPFTVLVTLRDTVQARPISGRLPVKLVCVPAVPAGNPVSYLEYSVAQADDRATASFSVLLNAGTFRCRAYVTDNGGKTLESRAFDVTCR